MTKHKRSLSDVVEEEREASGCMLCSIPERAEIEKERRTGGAEVRHIVQYLIKDCGYPEDKVMKQKGSKMSNHFIHHMEKTSE